MPLSRASEFLKPCQLYKLADYSCFHHHGVVIEASKKHISRHFYLLFIYYQSEINLFSFKKAKKKNIKMALLLLFDEL